MYSLTVLDIRSQFDWTEVELALQRLRGEATSWPFPASRAFFLASVGSQPCPSSWKPEHSPCLSSDCLILLCQISLCLPLTRTLHVGIAQRLQGHSALIALTLTHLHSPFSTEDNMGRFPGLGCGSFWGSLCSISYYFSKSTGTFSST